MTRLPVPPAASPSIEIRGLTKRYGRRASVRDVSLAVAPGEVYALAGPNGAGKTTLVRLVAGLAFPTRGRVRLLGRDPHRRPEVRRRLGAVVEAPAAFYPYLSGRANLRLHARLAGGVGEARIEEVLAAMDLTAASETRVGVYSLGMRQRLGLASALLARPDVLVLDEPANGVDPSTLDLVHRAIRGAAADGAAVLLTTHHLDEVATYGHRVGIMEEGALVDEIDLARRRHRIRLRVADPQAARSLLATRPWVSDASVRDGDVFFGLEEAAAIDRVAPLLVGAGQAPLELAPDRFDLSAYYRERVGRRRAAGTEGAA